MISITASALSKRFGYQWIVDDFQYVFDQNTVYGIAGSNGSGKSTLVKIISGYLTPSSGKISYLIDGLNVKSEAIYKLISLVGPYTDMINEYTLEEMFVFHKKFKPFSQSIEFDEFEKIIRLQGQRTKLLQHFSSGMRQKIQLALALLSDTPVLLMDEPTSFLDKNAKIWFKDLLDKSKSERVVIIASNDQFDLELCDEVVSLD
ncbi:MAG: ATP-binding cassette domain-containing protein [Saprospiraceae bacterium]|jgi:ABC-type multidrug transport system ATPase subunit|nr:ATP-binding cassette domain-containing protein [Saprospiraceae bacterium]MBL0027142.1 ATP-binding cassette domain-containing protein [Saprospiraceae bacterium]